jgi:hypothetical protein
MLTKRHVDNMLQRYGELDCVYTEKISQQQWLGGGAYDGNKLECFANIFFFC